MITGICHWRAFVAFISLRPSQPPRRCSAGDGESSSGDLARAGSCLATHDYVIFAAFQVRTCLWFLLPQRVRFSAYGPNHLKGSWNITTIGVVARANGNHRKPVRVPPCGSRWMHGMGNGDTDVHVDGIGLGSLVFFLHTILF
jgi:hypothetical protein